MPLSRFHYDSSDSRFSFLPTDSGLFWYLFALLWSTTVTGVGLLIVYRAISHASISELIDARDVPLLDFMGRNYRSVVLGTLGIGAVTAFLNLAVAAGRWTRITLGICWLIVLGGNGYASRFYYETDSVLPTTYPISESDWWSLMGIGLLSLILTSGLIQCLLGGLANSRPEQFGLSATYRSPLGQVFRICGVFLAGLIAVASHGLYEHIEFWDTEANGGYEYERFFAGAEEIEQATHVLLSTSLLFASFAALIGVAGYIVLRLIQRSLEQNYRVSPGWIMIITAVSALTWTLSLHVPWQLRLWTEIQAERGWILPVCTGLCTFSTLWLLMTTTLCQILWDTASVSAAEQDVNESQRRLQWHSTDAAIWTTMLFAFYPLWPLRRIGGGRWLWWSRTLLAAAVLVGLTMLVYQFEDWFDFDDWRGMLKRGQLPALRVITALLLGLIVYRIIARFTVPRTSWDGYDEGGFVGTLVRYAGGLLLMFGALGAGYAASWPFWGWQDISHNVFARTVEFSSRHDFELRFLHWLVDFDRDGYAAHLHGADHDDNDPDVQAGGFGSKVQFALPFDTFRPIANANGADIELPERHRFNLVVLYLEGIVPRAISAYGQRQLPQGLIATPGMDSVAEDGTVFTQARCFYPSTWDAWFSVCSGRYLHITEMNDSQPFGDRYQRYNNLYKILEQSGIDRWCHADCNPYRDLLVPQKYHGRLKTDWDLPAPFKTSVSDEEAEQDIWRGDKRNERIIKFIESLEPGERFFITEHMSDSHFPWNRTELERAEQLGFPDGLQIYEHDARLPDGTRNDQYSRYYQVITRVDGQIAAIMDALRAKGVYDDTVVVIASDHGCQWWEHEHMYYVGHLYEQSVRIPLIVRIPGCPGGITSDEPVVHADVLPTIAELAGFEHVPHEGPDLPGRSLIPILCQREYDPDTYRRRDVPLMTHYDTLGLIHDARIKLIFDRPSGTYLLFDLLEDPEEMHNLADERPELLAEMLQRLRDYTDKHPEFIGEIAR